MIDSRCAWSSVQAFMRERCGVVLSDEQSYLLEARLGPVASELKFASVPEYVRAACDRNAPPPLAMRMIDAMTTHETFFFRDRPFWKSLEETLLPRLINERTVNRPLRVWSAACSSGQEIFSLAMLLDELWPDMAAAAEYFATDISALSLAQGQAASYSVLEINRGLSSVRLMRHFEQDGARFRVRDRLRERIRWSTFNFLGHEPAPPPCDLILCRNVLIYFDEKNRFRALRRLADGAMRQGIVGVGASELLPGVPIAAGLYSAAVLFDHQPELTRASHDYPTHA